MQVCLNSTIIYSLLNVNTFAKYLKTCIRTQQLCTHPPLPRVRHAYASAETPSSLRPYVLYGWIPLKVESPCKHINAFATWLKKSPDMWKNLTTFS